MHSGWEHQHSISLRQKPKNDDFCLVLKLVELTIVGEVFLCLPISGTTWSKLQTTSTNLDVILSWQSMREHCHCHCSHVDLSLTRNWVVLIFVGSHDAYYCWTQYFSKVYTTIFSLIFSRKSANFLLTRVVTYATSCVVLMRLTPPKYAQDGIA